MDDSNPQPSEDVSTSCTMLQLIGCAAFACGGVGGYFLISQALKDGSRTSLMVGVAVALSGILQGTLVYVFAGTGKNAMAAARNSQLQVRLLKQVLGRLPMTDAEPTKKE